MNNFIVVSIALLVPAYSGANFESQHGPLQIVNGTDAEEGEFPYMVQLLRESSYACGGGIIGEKWILTAGHCLRNNISWIVYGTNNYNDDLNSTVTKVKVKNSYRHPKFLINRTSIYDVGILELEEAIPFSDKAQPIKLADSNDVPFHVPGVLAGWGVNKTYSLVASKSLKKIELKLLNDTECAQAINMAAKTDIGFDGVHDLCSDDHWNGQCYGDSGCPFVIDSLVYGVVSWSVKPCGSSPGTYSRLTNPEYRSFIKNVTGI